MSARNIVCLMFAACAALMACAVDSAEIRNENVKHRFQWNVKVDTPREFVGVVVARKE